MRRTVSEIAWVAAPKLAGGVLTLCLNILLLHLWAPEVYGVYAVCVTIVLLADAVFGSSLDLATLRLASSQPQSDPAAAHVIKRTALQVKLLASAVALPLVMLVAHPLALALFHQPGYSGVIVTTVAAAISLLLLRSMLVHAQLERRFKSYALLEAIHYCLKFGGVAILLLWSSRAPVAGIMALYVAGPAVAFAAGLVRFRDAALWSTRLDTRRLREFLGYVRWYALSGGVGNLLGRADLFMLSVLASPRELGLFAGAQTFAAVPWLLASYLSVVLSPRIMPLLQRGEYREFHRRTQKALYGVAGLMLVATVTVLDERVLSLFPASFRESSKLLQILLLGTAVSFATFPLALPLVMFRRPRFTLIMDCIFAPVVVILYGRAIATHGAEGAAWVTTASLIVRGGIVQATAWRLSAEPLG